MLKEFGYLPMIRFNKVLDIALASRRLKRRDIYVTQAFHLIPQGRSEPSDYLAKCPFTRTTQGSGGTLPNKTFAGAISAYGASVKPKLSNPAIGGAPEDQLRAPLETLVHDLAEIGGLSAKSVQLVGETTLAHLQTRPDYALEPVQAAVLARICDAPLISMENLKEVGSVDDTAAETTTEDG